MKVVCDTNIFISAILFGGKPEEIIKRGKEGSFEIVISNFILHEIIKVLTEKFNAPFEIIQNVIMDLRSYVTLISPQKYHLKIKLLFSKKMIPTIGYSNVGCQQMLTI